MQPFFTVSRRRKCIRCDGVSIMQIEPNCTTPLSNLSDSKPVELKLGSDF